MISSGVLLSHPLPSSKCFLRRRLLSFENCKSSKVTSCEKECCPFYFRSIFSNQPLLIPQQSYPYRSNSLEVFFGKGVLTDPRAISKYAILVTLLLILKLLLPKEILLSVFFMHSTSGILENGIFWKILQISRKKTYGRLIKGKAMTYNFTKAKLS